MRHHAFILEGSQEEGIAAAERWAERELGMKTKGNADVIVLRYGLLSVEEARQITELAAGAPFAGEHKIVIVAAARAYHEAQNALLKVFEEPPPGAHLFLILPTLGGLLPTLRSRVQVLAAHEGTVPIPEAAVTFLKASREKRTAIIKKLATGKGDDERREHRDAAIAIVNGIEAAAYAAFRERGDGRVAALLSDIAILRTHLYDRSAPVRMILEHLSLVLPKGLPEEAV